MSLFSLGDAARATTRPTTSATTRMKRLPRPQVPVRQCALILPTTGKRCGSVALRGDQFCRHHAENHLPITGERDLCERLNFLTKKMDKMDTPLLLDFLRQKLIPLQKTLRRFPDVAHTLTYTLDRLETAKFPKSNTSRLPLRNQKFTREHQAILNEISNFGVRFPESMI